MKFKKKDVVKFAIDSDLGAFSSYDIDEDFFTIDHIVNDGTGPFERYDYCVRNDRTGESEYFTEAELISAKEYFAGKRVNVPSNTEKDLLDRIHLLEQNYNKLKRDVEQLKGPENPADGLNREQNYIRANFKAGASFELDGDQYVTVVQTGQDLYVFGGQNGNPFELYQDLPESRDAMIEYLEQHEAVVVELLKVVI